jgi:hypothetical protein
MIQRSTRTVKPKSQVIDDVIFIVSPRRSWINKPFDLETKIEILAAGS